MNKIFYTAFTAVALGALSLAPAQAGTATQIDKDFVAMVSQGGMYEVIASEYAEDEATAPDVKDLAITEDHDHQGVGAQLKQIATQDGITIDPNLNAMFSARLAKLKAVPKDEFDAYYIADMKSIHAKDEKAFAKEAVEGSSDFTTFAHQTDLIVKRHIGALKA